MDANSAYDAAVRLATSAAMRNETMATVPTLLTASPERTKMPAAIIVPIPMAAALQNPIERSPSSLMA
jgi:hypothetical protein